MKTKRLLSALMCVVLVFTLLPMTAQAASVSYIDENGNAQTATDPEELTSLTSTLSNGWYVVNQNVTCSGNITVSGNVNLIVEDGMTLTVTGNAMYAGINVSGTNSLTVYGQSGGTGTVNATGSTGSAGIGGGNYVDGGTVTIIGGTVNATGSSGAAGIGGGSGGDGGSVTISGGTVTAIGLDSRGAGIGGGSAPSTFMTNITGGTVTITGGSVLAQGNQPIGVGQYSTGGDVTPVNGSGAPVYLTTVTLDGVTARTAMSSLTTDAGYAYGISGMATDTSGKLYLYLPANTLTTNALAAGNYYSGSVTTVSPSVTGTLNVTWDGSTKDIGWYVEDSSSASFTISDGSELAGLAALVNAGSSGTVYYDNTYMISSDTSLQYVTGTNFTGKTITLTKDIDLGGWLTTPSNWTPIGNSTNQFTGIFDGNSFGVKNLYINNNDDEQALFGYLGSGGTVVNLNLVDCSVNGDCDIAGIAANLYGTIDRCTVTGIVTGNTSVGGIVATIYSGANLSRSFEDATVTANESSARVGGIAGTNSGTVSDCWSAGTVDNSDGGGGIVGSIVSGTVINCYTTATVSGNNAGRIVGYNGSGSVQNCYYLALTGVTTGGIGASLNPVSSETTEKTAAELSTAEMAWILNTANGTETNSGIWAQETTPVFADSTHAAVYRILLTNSSSPTEVYSDLDASVTLPANPTGSNGKYFFGWYSDDAYVSPYMAPAVLSSDVTIYGNFGTRIISLADYTTAYTGSGSSYSGTVFDNAGEVTGAGAPTYTYYTDQGVTKTANNGAAPTAAGTYYVQATAAAAGEIVLIDAAASNFAVMTITSSSYGSSGSTYYTVTATQSAGGTISLSKASVPKYGSVTAAVTPNDGYRVTDVTVNGVSVGAATSYTILNITENKTVTAVFEKEWVNPYSDVSSGAWYYDAVGVVSGRGLMKGISSDTFSPDSTMTRAMFVTVLYRLSGETGSYTNTFSDVPSGMWYENATSWAAANGIAGGVGNGKFSPNGSITREQLTVMLYRYEQYMSHDVSVGEDTNILSYKDAFNISEYAYSALQWACGAGIISGDDTGNLNPQSAATRAEVAALLQRFITYAAKD